MTSRREHISVRTTRLNNLMLGNPQGTSKTSKNVSEALSREGLLDALFVLYNECNKDNMKKRDKDINEFTTKYRSIIKEANSLRITYDDFKVKAQIGKGFFGNVYLVEEKTTGDIYAMKKINKCGITNSQVKEERDIMAKRDSEWVVSLQYAFQDFDNLYLIMEYLPGGDLLSLMIRNGPFDEDLAKFYLAELTLALNALHNMGYVHRDIKPENILIDRFGHIKLGDFGNAAALDKDGHVTSLSPVGTPDYIAPELLQTISASKLTKSIHDVKCDFWSMGVIGYELIFETTPFHEENVHDTYSKILSYCDDSSPDVITYPADATRITSNFKNLLEGLITRPSIRLTYKRIIRHPFFEDVDWDTLHQQAPPIIPTVRSNDDISNFEDIERNKGRRSTYIKRSITSSSVKTREFTGKDLPFLGYGFIHQEETSNSASATVTSSGFASTSSSSSSTINNRRYDDNHLIRCQNKIKELQELKMQQNEEIKLLQSKLLKIEKTYRESNSSEKILKSSEKEINKLKDMLNEKNNELAARHREIKSLHAAAKIEEENRLKNEAKISELLKTTYQKWEKAKLNSDRNYEKQIAEKKTEISTINQKLLTYENELITKSDECEQLKKKIENYKEMLKSTRDRNSLDKEAFEKSKKLLEQTYEMKIIELQTKLKTEKDSKIRLSAELRDVRHELDESMCSSTSSQQEKLIAERSMSLIQERLNKEIDLNNNLKSQNAILQKKLIDCENNCDQLKNEIEKLKQELQLFECSKRIQLSEHASPYQTAHGSLTELSTASSEEQLRTDLQVAKEQEDLQRKRADKLEKVVNTLENLITKLKEPPLQRVSGGASNILEKQNEKLGDQLASAREQAIIERQTARSANLSLWKLEKQIEDMQQEKKQIQRKLDVSDEKMKKIQSEKSDFERRFKEAQDIIKQRDARVNELKDEILLLKSNIQKEHDKWEKSENERIKEKSDNCENVIKINQLNDKVEELSGKLKQTQQKYDQLNFENKRLIRQLNDEHENSTKLQEKLNDLEHKLKFTLDNLEYSKLACTVTDTQLSELEVLLQNEQKCSKEKQEKLDKSLKTLREKDELISKLKQNIDAEKLLKNTLESKIRDLEQECDHLKADTDRKDAKIIDLQTELQTKTTNLFACQENCEILQSEIANLKVLNTNYEKQILILKEENSRILSDLFLSKEDLNKSTREFKLAQQQIQELKKEIEQLNGTLNELKIYYREREIKSETTIQQHGRLIDFLKSRLDELQSKKKKTLADKIFGNSSSAAKENVTPNVIESSTMYKKLQDELKSERQLNKKLRDELSKLKNENHLDKGTSQPSYQQLQKQLDQLQSPKKENKIESFEAKIIEHHQQQQNREALNKIESKLSVLNENHKILSKIESPTSSNNRPHRFELSLENLETKCGTCTACQRPIVAGSPYWLCKECKCSAHRKCRTDVLTLCGQEYEFHQAQSTSSTDGEREESSTNVGSDTGSVNFLSSDNNNDDDRDTLSAGDVENNYVPELILRSNVVSPPLEINCVYEIFENIILIGSRAGLFAFNLSTKSLVHINGLDGVTSIGVTERLSKALFIGSNGTKLYQCDLRLLQNRSQSSSYLKPKIDLILLDLPLFLSHHHAIINDNKWHLIKISNIIDNPIDTTAICAATTHIAIMKYDVNVQKFIVVRTLDSAQAVTSIIFTRHTAIVSSDKFFEIDLQTYQAEEFVDISDSSLSYVYKFQPVNIFKITSEEFLLCFTECGIFVDSYGCRSRPYDIQWQYLPTGFIYREPILYISHFQLLQIMRIHRSYSNELSKQDKIKAVTGGNKRDDIDDGEDDQFLRTFVNLYSPIILAESGKTNIYAASIDKDTNLQELHIIDGIQSLKKNMNISLETLSSEGTCLTLDSERENEKNECF